MPKFLVYRCDQCGLEVTELEARFWSHLQLVYPAIDTGADTRRYYLCSKNCLREFVKELKGK